DLWQARQTAHQTQLLSAVQALKLSPI
ncbi:MAG: hypothetical protein RIQ38_1824, partial [Pseudomonadota bacterium]